MRLSAFAFLLVLASAAHAQDAPTVPPQVTAMFPLGEEVCYSAAFKPSDMKKGQKLTAIQMYRLFDPDPLKESVEFTRQEAIAFDLSGTNGNWTDLTARFSDKPILYAQRLECSYSEDSDRVSCGVECDGGGFAAALKGQDIEAHFGKDSSGLALNESCGDPDDTGSGRRMTPVEAGGSFTFKKANIDECRSLDAQVKPAFVKGLPPLRQRIDDDGWRCLARVYDKAHLAKHPKQNVTAMALTIAGPVTVDREAGSHPYAHVDVLLSFKTRKGKTHARGVSCAADGYQLHCDGGFRLRRTAGNSLMLLAGDGEEGIRPTMLDVPMAADDRVFRLDVSPGAACKAD